MQHHLKESCQGQPYLGVHAYNLLQRSSLPYPPDDMPSWVVLHSCNCPCVQYVTKEYLPTLLTWQGAPITIFTSNVRLCVKGSIRSSPPLARRYVNQHPNTLATIVGLSLPDHINTLPTNDSLEFLHSMRPCGKHHLIRNKYPTNK